MVSTMHYVVPSPCILNFSRLVILQAKKPRYSHFKIKVPIKSSVFVISSLNSSPGL